MAALSPVDVRGGGRLTTKTYCGGPTKDHILESGGSGVALFDYDGDGLLDIYLVTAAELTPARERIPHRNALYRNLGGWKFEDVSKQAGVDVAAWGNGVCAGDVDGDGRLDLYVTNWGPNFLFRNRGDGTFEEIAAAGGRRGRRLEHRLHVLRRRRRRRSRPLRRALRRDDVGRRCVRAQRTLVWRNGPHIMVGPAGTAGRGRPVLREPRQRHASSKRPTPTASPIAARAYGFGVVATDYDDDGLRRSRSSPTTRTPTSCTTTSGTARFESVGLVGRRRA